MTNEELATLIQNGDDGYLPDLWEQVRKLIRMKAKQYLRHFVLCGGGTFVDEDDLTQCGYYAVLAAVKYYSPSAGYKFTTYLSKTLQNAFREALGIRTSKRDPCRDAIPLDTPSLNWLDSHDSSLIQVDESVYNQDLRRELDKILLQLPDSYREILTLHFFFGISYLEQAETKGVTLQDIANQADAAIERIRGNPKYMSALSEFMPEYDFDPYRNTGLTSWAASGQSVEEKFIASLDKDAAALLI